VPSGVVPLPWQDSAAGFDDGEPGPAGSTAAAAAKGVEEGVPPTPIHAQSRPKAALDGDMQVQMSRLQKNVAALPTAQGAAASRKTLRSGLRKSGGNGRRTGSNQSRATKRSSPPPKRNGPPLKSNPRVAGHSKRQESEAQATIATKPIQQARDLPLDSPSRPSTTHVQAKRKTKPAHAKRAAPSKGARPAAAAATRRRPEPKAARKGSQGRRNYVEKVRGATNRSSLLRVMHGRRDRFILSVLICCA
jgi:hypothetical protein